MIITGIGSRETPNNILKEMQKIGEYCLNNKITVRSGHADGADWAFEKGAQERCIVYLPSNTFNNHLISKSKKVIVPDNIKYDKITDQFHPNPRALSKFARLLMNRNACQVLGLNLDKATNYIICWTKDGQASGGTGQALRIAKAYHIPVFNMYFEELNTFEKIVPKILKAA